MNRSTMSKRTLYQASALLLFAGASMLVASDAHGVGMANLMKAKSLPDATVAVVDPESGTSTGGGTGGNIRLQAGDIILFRFAFSPVPDKANRSIQSYLTEYIPPNTEIVGVRIIDADGRTIEPRLPGLALDGCAGGAKCNTFNSLPCSTGTCRFDSGSVAQVHADTGVFFSTDARLARVPNNAFITMDNGVLMNPIPAGISPDILQLLDRNDSTLRHYSHNQWDWIQVRAYGISNTNGNAAGTGGGGNTPYLYGSPVAGPETFYRFEATEVGGAIRFNNVPGPWRRIRYPGSKIGTGSAFTGSTALPARALRDPTGTEVGWDVTPANPVRNARAVRFALGDLRTGVPQYVEVALRVTAVPIDPNFGAMGENLNCGESFGSGLANRGNANDGDNHPWLTYIGSTSCVYLKLLFDIKADKELALGSTINYTIDGKNLSLQNETGVVIRQVFESNRSAYIAGSAVPPPDGPPAPCPAPYIGKDCLTWTLGTLQPSEEYVITTSFTAGGGGNTSAVMQAVYRSNQLPEGFITRDTSIITGIALPNVTVRPEGDPTQVFVRPNTTTRLVGTMANAGTNDVTFARLELPLPTSWRSGGPITVGGTNYPCTSGCATNRPVYNLNLSFLVGQSRNLVIPVQVPAGTATGLYPIDIQIWTGQGGFGGDFETYYPKAAILPVGAVRTQPPVLNCPIGSTNTSITGTSEPNANIRALFTLIERGTGTANAAGAFSVSNYGAFGELYGGLEVRATAQAPGELESELSVPCEVTSLRACSDGVDNDGDGQTDFPADIGCTSPGDSDETNVLPQCADGIDNDGDRAIDWPADTSCDSAADTTESGAPACSDGIDNDGDGARDFPADPDCTSATGVSEATLMECQNRIDDDGDGRIDFGGLGAAAGADPGCHSDFDDDESDLGYTPVDVEPRLLVVFDTSGSMHWNTCTNDFTGGDGSLEFPGRDVVCSELPMSCTGSAVENCDNGTADDSRMYQVKQGIADVIAAFGEVEYGLMRFHQRSTTFGPPSVNASLSSGGWQGGGAAPCSGGFNAGDVLVSFSPDNQESIIDWLDGSSNYAGTPPPGLDLELRGSGTTPLGGALVSALEYLDDVRGGDARAACRPYRVILVTDGQETCGGNPTVAARALYQAGIPVKVIGFATGDPEVVASLNAIANAGSDPLNPQNALFVDDESALSAAIASIVTEALLVESCNSLDDDCDGMIDEGFGVGQTCDNGELGVCYQTGLIECAASGFDTSCSAPPGMPNGTETCNLLDDDCNGLIDDGITCNCNPNESCNGIDDDCDGAIDEAPIPGVGLSCGLDIGACQPGTLVCVSNPGPPPSGSLECRGGVNPAPNDTCNGIDDDCDTFVDEEPGQECYEFATGCTPGMGCMGECRTGYRACVGGQVGECVGDVGPATERCNGLDDDCDGNVDETWPNVGQECSNGLEGACEAFGVVQCTPNGLSAVCTAPVIPPGTETCNGRDDDCDTNIDEALGAPVGNMCGGGAECTPGVFQCVADGMGGASIQCVGSAGGEPETCNGIDDDCDMNIDEAIAGVGESCTAPGYEDQGDTGECAFGQVVCSPPAGLVCMGYVGPSDEETCDARDNDCDGQVDEMAQCPGAGEMCINGECAFPCREGEFPCPFGYYCETLQDGGRFCLADPCATVECPAGQACDEDTGACVDQCLGVECEAGETCQAGQCVDCFVLGCADGQICVQNQDGVGVCMTDPCADAGCASDEFCRDGQCIPLVCEPACGAGESCIDGMCQADRCAGKDCPMGEICEPDTGACVRNPCAVITCSAGQACNPSTAMCDADPCIGVDCPDSFTCQVRYDGSATCVEEEDPSEYVYASGAGCVCSVGTGRGPGAGSVLLWLAVAGVLLRRRRRSRN